MPQTLFYNPGQQVTLLLQVLDSNNQRADGYQAPTVDRILSPSFAEASGYPVAMGEIDAGLYYHKFTLPQGASAVGTYIVDVSWPDPDTMLFKQDVIQIVVTAPYGLYTVTPG